MTFLIIALSVFIAHPVYAQSGGSVQVETNLPNAKVYLDEVLIGETTERFGKNLLVADGLNPGVRKLKISLPPYSDNVRDITITAGETVRIVHTFQTASVQATSQTGRIETQSKYATGTIKVVSKPVDCEMILDDGIARARTGKDSGFLNVPVGKRKVTVKASQKDVLTIEFNLEEGQTITVTADFMSSPARIAIDAEYMIIIKSSPPSSLKIDGKDRGTTPVALTLKYGQYELELGKQGYAPKKERLAVIGNGIHEYSLSELARTLSVTTDPAASTVYLNGKPIGPSPIADYPVTIGTYELRAEKSGFIRYASEPQTFEVGLQDTRVAKVINLAPKAATITVFRDSEYSVDLPVSCNGQVIGSLGKGGTILVPAGSATLQIGNTVINRTFDEGGSYSLRGVPLLPLTLKPYTDPLSVPGAKRYPDRPSLLSEVTPVYKKLPNFFGMNAFSCSCICGFLGMLGGLAYGSYISPDDNSQLDEYMNNGILIGAGSGWVVGAFTDFKKTKVREVPNEYNINKNRETLAAFEAEKAHIAEYNARLLVEANKRVANEETRIKRLNEKRGIIELVDLRTKALETYPLK